MYKRPRNPKKKLFAPSIEGSVKKQLDEGAIIQGARRQAALIWDAFQMTLRKLALEKKLNAFDMPQHLNDLAAKIQKEIKNERVRVATMDLIDLKIADTARFLKDFKMVMDNTVQVIAHCSNESKDEETDEPTGLPCDYTARIRVDKKEFERCVVEFECPDCGGKIKWGDMTPLEEQK